MTDTKYVAFDVHTATIVIVVLDKRAHWTCNTCAKAPRATVLVRCAGCGVEREVYRRTAQAEPNYSYLLCGECAREQQYEHPTVPEGMIRSVEFNVFGFFTACLLRTMTEEDRESIERARRIRDIALDHLSESDSKWLN